MEKVASEYGCSQVDDLYASLGFRTVHAEQAFVRGDNALPIDTPPPTSHQEHQ